MGIFINLNIADTITEEEWEKAYQKSVQLVEMLPFMEKITKECYGEELICGAKTIERERYGEVGWHTIGDSISLKWAEDYFLPRNIMDVDKAKLNNMTYVDPYMSILRAYGEFDLEDERCDRVKHFWGSKTQAEPYHFYLLAVACMLENELPGKVAIYGDITKGQCKRAAKIASDLLGEQIEMPDRCDLQRLYNRVKKMPLQENEIVDVFRTLYLGNPDEVFGSYIQKQFESKELKAFWNKHLGHSEIGTYGFSNWLKDYLLWGFQVAELKNYIKFKDKDGNDLKEKFVREILETEIFIEEKNCEDVLETDHEAEESYSIYTLFAQFAFAGARNRRVNRYIPLEDLKKELRECVGESCDIDQIVTKYMEERAQKKENDNPSDRFNDFMSTERNKIVSARKKCDILDPEDLMWFENNDIIDESLNEILLEIFKFYRKLLEEDTYEDLIGKQSKDAIRFLIRQNRCFLFMEESWEKIFKEIEKDIKAFERYYPMVRVNPTRDEQFQIIQAIVLNDELYQYCMENYTKNEEAGLI